MAQSIKVNNTTFLIPEASDPCPIWKSYYNVLRKEVGRDHAKVLWLLTWKSNANASCLTDPIFSKWLTSQGLHVSNLAARTIADLSEISGNYLGLGKQFSKVLAIGIPTITVFLIVGMIFIIKNSAQKLDLVDVAALTPAGKGFQLLK